MIVSTSNGYIGPFKQVEVLGDRLRCDGMTDLPFSVIGTYEVLEDDSLMPIVVPIVPPPKSITMRQCRLQLYADTAYDTVNAAVATMPTPAQIEWEYANDIERNNPLVGAMQVILGWDDARVAQFFTEAAKL